MKPFRLQQVCVAAVIGIAAVCVSCNRHGDTSGSAVVSKSTKPAPEESFDRVMETFHRRMEETPIGFVIADGSGRSTFSGTNKVTEELIRPATPNDPYKAVVTVVSRSNYSIKRVKESDDPRDKKTARDETAAQGRADVTTETSSTSASQPADAAKNSASGKPADDFIARRPDEEVRKYELLYKDGRWVLITALNRETEQSIQNAFNSALAAQ